MNKVYPAIYFLRFIKSLKIIYKINEGHLILIIQIKNKKSQIENSGKLIFHVIICLIISVKRSYHDCDKISSLP